MPNPNKFIRVDESISLFLPETDMSEELFQLIDRQRAYLGKWLIWVERTKSVQDSFSFLQEANIFNQGGKQLTTIIKYNNKIVGAIGFVKLDLLNKNGEIGYWISENMQGKGIITNACKKLIDYAFKQLKLNRIVLKTDAQNTKSKAIAIRMGFTHEGTLRDDRWRNGSFRDTELYSLLKNEWMTRLNR